MANLKDLPVLFIDCQTTGASPQHGQIIELGWAFGCAADEDAQVETRLIALPDGEQLPLRISRLTGITGDDMLEALPAKKVVKELRSVAGQLPQPQSLAIAHYSRFEETFLQSMFAENSGGDKLPFTFVCTCLIAKKLYPDLPSRAIRALCGYLGLTVDEEKRSSSHVQATFFIWKSLVDRLATEGVYTSEELLPWLALPLPKRPKNAAYSLPMEKLKRLDLPDSPGIYRMLSLSGKVLYVGKATSLKDRVNSYFRGRKGKDSKTKELISQIHDLQVEPLATPLEAALRETDEIKKYNPPYNRALKEKGRGMVFYNRQFDQESVIQNQDCPIGPFVGETLAPLKEFCQSYSTGEFSEALFWNLADIETIKEGVSLFAENYLRDFTPSQVVPRKLLALGLALYRVEVNLARQAGLEEELEDELEELEEEEIVDATTIHDMIVGIIVRSARAYWQSKKMTALLNCRALFRDGERNEWRFLQFADGQMVEADFASPQRLARLSKLFGEDFQEILNAGGISAIVLPEPSRPDLPWSGHTLATWDRIRVLSTELNRVMQQS